LSESKLLSSHVQLARKHAQKAYHPFADIPSDAELMRRFTLMAGDVQKRVRSFPLHDEYIRMHCAAPPPQKAM
jgi:hypothetical protein